MKKLVFLIIFLLLAGCESSVSPGPSELSGSAKLEGTYFNDSNNRSLTFNSNGTGFESAGGAKMVGGDFTFSVEGKSIKIGGMISPYVVLDDRSIGGVALGRFVKK